MDKKEYMKQWHQDNKERRLPEIKARKLAHRKNMSKWLAELKESTPCADCNLYWPSYVMQFDHLPEFEKTINIADAVNRYWSQSRLQTEIDKCEIVCGNCHAIRTHKRRMGL